MLVSCRSIITVELAILFPLESCFVFLIIDDKNATRKFPFNEISPEQDSLLSFDGATFKTEASTRYPHLYVFSLGSYRNLPFVTGQQSDDNGLKTEILDYEANRWAQVADYPFSTGYR